MSRLLARAVVLGLLASACTQKTGRASLDGRDTTVTDQPNDDTGSKNLTDPTVTTSIVQSPLASPPAAPDCMTPFRHNDHVATFHCADDYLTAVAAFPEVTPAGDYYVFRALAFLLAAPELSVGLRTFLGVFSVSDALPWTKNLFSDSGVIELVSDGLRAEGPVDVRVKLAAADIPFSPRYVAYVTSESANDGNIDPAAKARLVLVEPRDATDDTLSVQLVVNRLGSFDVTDGTPIDAITGCTAASPTAPCLDDGLTGGLDGHSFAAFYDAALARMVYFALDTAAQGAVDASELGIAPGEFLTLVPPVGPATPLRFIELESCDSTLNGCVIAATNPRTLEVDLRTLVDKVTPIEVAALQKAVAIIAPLTGSSVTADQILSTKDGFAPGPFFYDFLSASVRSAKPGSSLNDIYSAFLDVTTDLNKYVVADLQHAYVETPTLTFSLPREIFRTSEDVELTGRELKIIRTIVGFLTAAGEVVGRAIRLGGNLITKELVWDTTRDDIDHTALTNALNAGFLVVLDEDGQADFYREKISSQLGAIDAVITDLSAADCKPTALFGCMSNAWGARYHTLVGEAKSVVDAGDSANAPLLLPSYELGNWFCSDSYPNKTGDCAAVGATGPTNGGFTFAAPPASQPYTADFGGIAYTHRLRSPLVGAGVPFFVNTLSNGAKRISFCSMQNADSPSEREACLAGATPTTPLFFDVIGQHFSAEAGMRVPSQGIVPQGSPTIWLDATPAPKPADPLLGDEPDFLTSVVQPLLDRSADSPLSRVKHLISP